MATRRILAASLATLLAFGISPALAQQANGVLAGRATDEARQPYTEYSVQLRDPSTGQVVGTVALSAQAQFSFNNVQLSRKLLVELTKQGKVICTEGPYALSTGLTSKTDVNISCGKTPAALWLLTAAAGTAAAVAVATRSASQ
ncbi:MAG: hypothetical protein ABI051_05605 [Vicinamibacterales bacterium]